MKILLVSQYYPPHIGGLEVVVKKQAESLRDFGHSVSVVTCVSSGVSAGVQDEDGIRVERISALNFFDTHFRIPFSIPSPSLLLALRRQVKTADLVHIHDVFYLTSFFAYLIAALYQKPVFLTQHVALVKHPSWFVMGMQKIVYFVFGSLLFTGSRAIVTYNPIVTNFLIGRGVSGKKIHEVRNGVDLSLFRPGDAEEKARIREKYDLPREKILVLFAGRLVPKKGFRELVRAYSPEYELFFVGSGELTSEEKSFPNVHFLGAKSQRELAELYRGVDIFVLPSRGELFTLSMQEAMASGLPIVTTLEPEYVRSDLDLSLIGFADPQTDALRERLVMLARDSEIRKQMGAYGIAYAREHFNWNTNIENLISLYTLSPMQPSVYVTTSWDDGHMLDLKLAELLKKYGIKGTFYIAPMDREVKEVDRLADEQLRLLSDSFEIGAHTLTHPRLTTISDDEARREIHESKMYLENVLGKSVSSFCYPGGAYAPIHADMVREAGFALGRTVERFSFSKGSSPWLMPTTMHTYRHWSDAWPILKAVGVRKFMRCYLNWDQLAIELFNTVSKKGGVFHLWGHSWETDHRKDWDRLERVLEHIGGRENVFYVTNGQLPKSV